jgi:catechol 2,3-dioxygenase-like lactoylglutathione lyase family enzyme
VEIAMTRKELTHVVPIQRIRAIALTISDLDRSVDFYTKAFGFAVVSQDRSTFESFQAQIATLQLGQEQIRLMQFPECDSQPIPDDSQSTDLWFQHFAIVVSDMERAYEQVRSFPIQNISPEPQTLPKSIPEATGVKAFKFKDPDGHNLELIWFPPDKRPAKWNSSEPVFLGLDHSAMTVASTKQSLQFYQDLLKMKVESSSLHEGAEQARLDGLPEANVQVTGLRPIGAGFGVEFLDYLAPARSFPQDWRVCDIPHLHLELVVNDLEPALQNCMIRDPDGHALLLVSQ